jgi:Mevalonate kinase
MRRERNTLVGTPTIIAPGAISLVGEFGLPEEEVAVLAALSSHATAQYFPDVAPLSPLVAAVVERAKAHLGEDAAALPAGSVLLSPAEAGEDGEGLAFETTAAIAVATAAAVFETAGQSIRERKDEILVVAEAAHRAVHGGIGAEGELAAALHGGLIKVVFQPAAAPRIEALAAPAGLHLVVFRTGNALFPAGWLASVRQFAERERIAYAQIIDELIEQAGRFAAQLSEGNATAAIASAERYGRCITQLAAAASVSLQSPPFLQATALAKEIGGIAKTTNAGRGDLGIAMFATPEAANLFARACRPPLVALGLDLDRLGVRRLALSQTGESAVVHTPAPETGASSISAEAIVRSSVDDRTTERTLSEPDDEPPPTPQPAVAQGEAPEEPRAPKERPALEEAALEDVRPVRQHRSRAKVGLAVGGVLIVAALVAVWLSKPRGHAPPVTRPTLRVPSLPPPRSPEPPPPVEAQVVPLPDEAAAPPVAPSSDSPPPLAKPHTSAYRSLPSGRANGKRLPGASPAPKPTAPPAHGEPPKPRAGKLSPDDF